MTIRQRYKNNIFTLTLLLVLILAGCTELPDQPQPSCAEIAGDCIFARTGESHFEIYLDDTWQEITVKGVNIGTSLPGRWYTEFPADRDLYQQWLKEITAMNANTIRIYTLLDPAFYAVLAEHNADPENETLWLFQEIWPHDDVPALNLHDPAYRNAYQTEIELTIDALHGNADIPARSYRAYGKYSTDVSPYLLGLMIGRELEPDEVRATDELNAGPPSFQGQFVTSSAGATPTESWLTEMCDYALAYSSGTYNLQYPVGFVSWPTLDPLTHRTEWGPDGTPGYNDRETVDPNVFTAGPQNNAGFFGAYHIYPNYPDFMNNEAAFAEYSDEEGVFRYLGYLNHFMAIHPPYPALVAEFGISTSLNTAHINPEGLNHGGLSEKDQGEMIVRMMRAIIAESYAGGLIFEWSDEWAKKTWNTEPFMVSWERQVLWQNAMCPEQNYGLLAVEPQRRSLGLMLENWHVSTDPASFNPPEDEAPSFGQIELIETAADEAFFYLALTLSVPSLISASELYWDKLGLAVGIDVGLPESGELVLPFDGLPELPGRAQFLLDLRSPEDALLLAVPSYNRGLLTFNPGQTSGGSFETIETLVNREKLTVDGLFFPSLYANESLLNYGSFHPEEEAYNSLAHWYIEPGGRIVVRLPWMLLNVSDPSSGLIIRDSRDFESLPTRDELATIKSEGFKFYAVTYQKGNLSTIDFFPRLGDKFNNELEAWQWEGWEEPQYQFRLKKSYQVIASYFETIR